METGTPEEEADRRKYWVQNMMGVKDDRVKKGQVSFARKVLIRRKLLNVHYVHVWLMIAILFSAFDLRTIACRITP